MAFSTRVLRAFLASVEGLQISRDDLLAGLSIEAILDSEQWIENADFYQVIQRALQLSRDPALGLHVGEREHGHFTAFGAAGMLFSVVPTFREAVAAMASFHEVARDHQDIFIRSEANSLAVGYELFEATGTVRMCLAELVLTNLTIMLRQFSGITGGPLRVQFDHPAPAHAAEYHRVFGCDVQFGCPRVALVVSNEVADRRQLLSNPELASMLRQEAEGSSRPRTLSERVRHQVRESWLSGAPTMETVARGLGMSQRSLHRHLAQHGLDYRSILNEARLQAAAALLRQRRLSVKQVAHEVGFSNASAFYRAFKRWTGVSPSEYVSVDDRGNESSPRS
jgi:AraC-like DNA-binding protein